MKSIEFEHKLIVDKLNFCRSNVIALEKKALKHEEEIDCHVFYFGFNKPLIKDVVFHLLSPYNAIFEITNCDDKQVIIQRHWYYPTMRNFYFPMVG